ncbi:hypothetical protein [Deinococcus alpinitundrae]|uniref:hypothetical protein n=1 Tax=Deinococcus alpinitundrae TaxID=468913 RepID=UPI00137ABA02|nr:hypothetical protein [Deinococcus alpinitundrae]
MTPPVFLAVDVSNVVARAYHASAAGKEGQSVIGLALHLTTSTLLIWRLGLTALLPF